MKSNNDNQMTGITIGEHHCNINRSESEIANLTLNNFSDAIPIYTKASGVNLEINPKPPSTVPPFIIKLNNSVTNGLIIPNSKAMSDDEYYSAFVSRKKAFVTDLVKKTYNKGYEEPSIIQKITISELIKRADAIIQFKSGLGKTHAFLFGCLWHFDPSDKELQHIFITSSHEVAEQILSQAKDLLPESTNIILCIGQGIKKNQTSSISGNFKTPHKSIQEERAEVLKAQIIVCTIGKFYDYLCNKKWIKLKFLKSICIDEFDAMIEPKSRSKQGSTMVMAMSTEEQIQMIMNYIPLTSQRIFFSATVSETSTKIASQYLRPNPLVAPLIILLDKDDYTLDGISQYYFECEDRELKMEIVNDILRRCRISQCIIFANTIKSATELKSFLISQSNLLISLEVFSGELPPATRKSMMENFRNNKIRVLISTDVTSRGLDIQGINLVINFDMPNDIQTYIHRIGRSGRYGRKGVAINLITVNASMNINEKQKVDSIDERSKVNKMKVLVDDLENLLL